MFEALLKPFIKHPVVTVGRRCLLRSGLFLLCFLLCGLRSEAHPMPPDVTSISMNIHYHLIDMTLRCPANELTAKVDASEMDGDATKPPVLEKLTQWLPSAFLLEKDHKPLTPEVVSVDFNNSARANEASCTLQVHYATDGPAEKLRVTSHFIHTIVSFGGVFFEMHSDKETVHEFDTDAHLENLWRNMQDFLLMGMNHLFTGPDHILFICTLIFALMDFKSVVKMLTGFTVGHSITLILSTFNVIHISGRLADMGIALTIMYVGIENIVRKEMPKNRWWLVTAFGLVHGMGFSSSLKEVGLPDQGLVVCLLAFNLGIEFAQIIIVAAIYPVLARLRWYKEVINEKEGTQKFRALMNYGSAFTACMGCYWFIQRLLTP